jgi:Ricin-type beta-trefoil lectin domain/Subtilase family
MAIIQTARRSSAGATRTPAATRVIGYSPANLRSAYKLTTAAGRGTGETIAIVDAYRDPRAETDLAAYRGHYGLPPCTLAGHCLRIVNEHGASAPLPKANESWAVEESIDLDMVSAICPHCRILLVEARTNLVSDLATAEDAAVSAGARFVSNSWSSREFIGEQLYDQYFNHPGVAITFSAGDSGYGTAYPTDIQYVTAVGGTTLRRSGNRRGWSETAWSGTGSGCSMLATKAPWQKGDDVAPAGCLNRTGNDVSADSNLKTGVSIYDSYGTHGTWLIAGGTSVASPIIAATYALAGTPAARTYPASYLYQHPGRFFDVTSGDNGKCEASRPYLCRGVRGYDGPTGLGTPDGITAFAHSATQVTVMDPGVQDVLAGHAFALRITGLDANQHATGLVYSATGLPAGLSIAPVPHSMDAKISGTLPATAATRTVTVRARDPKTGSSATMSFALVSIVNMASEAGSDQGQVQLDTDGHRPLQCLTDSAMTARSPVTYSDCLKQPDQTWSFDPDGAIGGPGYLQLNGLCLRATRKGAQATAAACDGSASERWQDVGYGLLMDSQSGLCLAASSTSDSVITEPCQVTSRQVWIRPAAELVSGAGLLCIDDTDFRLRVRTCDGNPGQRWLIMPRGVLMNSSVNQCLDGGTFTKDGQGVINDNCGASSARKSGAQTWLPGPNGELINARSGKCLADAKNGGPGSKIVLNDCYGQPGEIWTYN